MNESIYALIPQPVPEVQRAPRHISKHAGDKKPTFSTFGLTGTSKPGYVNIAGGHSGTATGHHEYVKPFATMGKEGNAIHPSEFLRKGHGGGGGAAEARGRDGGARSQPQRRLPAQIRLARARAAEAAHSDSRRARPRAGPSPPTTRACVPPRREGATNAFFGVRQASRSVGAAGRRTTHAATASSSLTAPAGGFMYTDRTRPAVPTKEELKQTKELLDASKKEPKNFVTSNAVENILAVPKREPQAVDWLKKVRRHLEPCGMLGMGRCMQPPRGVGAASACLHRCRQRARPGAARVLCSANAVAEPPRRVLGAWCLVCAQPCFGEVPPYLTKIKQEINDEYEYIKSMQQQADMEGPPGMHVMPEDTRGELILALKTKWDAVNKAYQQSSVLSLASLDTIGKVKRKEMYEAQLAQIEKDIEKLSKKTVYVTDE